MSNSKLCSIDGCGKPVDSRGWCSTHWARWRHHGTTEKIVRQTKTDSFIEGLRGCISDECVVWPFNRFLAGYGQIKRNGRGVYAHRLICERIHGAPPSSEHEAAHSCGNGHGGCVNPRHLRWATHDENMKDAVAHGTSIKGERHPGAKLTEREVLEIRKRVAAGEMHHKIAADFKVSRSSVGDIANFRRWGWLTR